MFIQGSISKKAFLTKYILEWLLFRMWKIMFIQVSTSKTSFLTNYTLEWLFFSFLQKVYTCVKSTFHFKKKKISQYLHFKVKQPLVITLLTWVAILHGPTVNGFLEYFYHLLCSRNYHMDNYVCMPIKMRLSNKNV